MYQGWIYVSVVESMYQGWIYVSRLNISIRVRSMYEG